MDKQQQQQQQQQEAGDDTEPQVEAVFSDVEESSGTEGEFSEEEEEEDNEEESGSGSSSSGSDDDEEEEMDRCPICLVILADQDIGMPESCDHDYCLECILEWSKMVNTCPVDRQVFYLILAKHSIDGVVYKKIPVEDRRMDPDEEDNVTLCEVCRRGDREDVMLLCDGCDSGYHLDCLTPALPSVPHGDWFCPECTSDHAPQIGYNARAFHIPRTRMTERLLNTIAPQREAHRRMVIYSSSDDEEEEEEEMENEEMENDEDVVMISDTEPDTSRPRTAKPRTKRKVKKRKTGRRKTRRKTKKTGSNRKTKSTKTSKSGKVRRKRKRRRKKTSRRARTKNHVPSTIRSRIADRLGLIKPAPGCTMPRVKNRPSRTIEDQRSDVGISALSLFGSRNELHDFYESGSEDDMGGAVVGSGQVALMTHQPHTSSHTSSHTNVLAAKTVRTPSYTRDVTPPLSASEPPLDLLGSILMSQELLNLAPDSIKIHRDGSLEARSSSKKPCDGEQGEGGEISTKEQNTDHSQSNQTQGSAPCETAGEDGTSSTGEASMSALSNTEEIPSESVEDVCKPLDDTEKKTVSPKKEKSEESCGSIKAGVIHMKSEDEEKLTDSEKKVQDGIDEEDSKDMINVMVIKPDSDSELYDPFATFSATDTPADSPVVMSASTSGNESPCVKETDKWDGSICKKENEPGDSNKTEKTQDGEPSKDLLACDSIPIVSSTPDSVYNDAHPFDDDSGDPLRIQVGCVTISEGREEDEFDAEMEGTLGSEEDEAEVNMMREVEFDETEGLKVKIVDINVDKPTISPEKEHGSGRSSKSQSKDEVPIKVEKDATLSGYSGTGKKVDVKKEKDASKEVAKIRKSDLGYLSSDDLEGSAPRGSNHKPSKKQEGYFKLEWERSHKRGKHHRSGSRDRDRGSSRDHYDKDLYRRSRSRDRSRSRERERSRRSRSREQIRRRSRSTDREDRSHRRRSRDRSRERKRRSRSRSFSPRRNRDSRRSRNRGHSHEDSQEYRGSVKMFSQSMKDAEKSATGYRREAFNDRSQISHMDSSPKKSRDIDTTIGGLFDQKPKPVKSLVPSLPSSTKEPPPRSSNPTNVEMPTIPPPVPSSSPLLPNSSIPRPPFPQNVVPPQRFSPMAIQQRPSFQKPLLPPPFPFNIQGQESESLLALDAEDGAEVGQLGGFTQALLQHTTTGPPPPAVPQSEAHIPRPLLQPPLQMVNTLREHSPTMPPNTATLMPSDSSLHAMISQNHPGLPTMMQHQIHAMGPPRLLVNTMVPPPAPPSFIAHPSRLQVSQFQSANSPAVIMTAPRFQASQPQVSFALTQNGTEPLVRLSQTPQPHLALLSAVSQSISPRPPLLDTPPTATEIGSMAALVQGPPPPHSRSSQSISEANTSLKLGPLADLQSLLQQSKPLLMPHQLPPPPPPPSDDNLFKVPLPPPPLPRFLRTTLDNLSKPSGELHTNDSTEIVDMEVSSPFSDDDDDDMAFSPPHPQHLLSEVMNSQKIPDKCVKFHLKTKEEDEAIPSSAVDLENQQKKQSDLMKLNRKERVVEEVKMAIKPHYVKGRINKEQYKDIMRKTVPKICHSRSDDINTKRICSYIEAYVEKVRGHEKHTKQKATAKGHSSHPKGHKQLTAHTASRKMHKSSHRK